jgi:hypothetical protein
MNTEIEQNILNSYCIELEVTDAWQLPAIYKIYKEGTNLQINELCFFSELNEEEYKNFIEKVLSYKVQNWENNYMLKVGEKPEEEYTWKLVIYYNENKKIIKRGKDTSPEEFADFEEFLIEVTE